LYFGGGGWGLWKSDGTEAGTILVKALMWPAYFTDIGGTLYFRADDGTSGLELWKSDGTEAGTVLVQDSRPGNADSNPRDLTNVHGTLYFTADDVANGRELWALRPDPVPGDLDGDLDVDSADVLSFLANWTGELEPGTGDQDQSTGDLDGDGDVDSSDLLTFLATWTGSQNADRTPDAAQAARDQPLHSPATLAESSAESDRLSLQLVDVVFETLSTSRTAPL
jgi:ELWxxDGT repeat protein